MKQLILKASEILEGKFKIKPKTTKLYVHENIKGFLSKTPYPNAQSIFFPKDLSAHVPRDRLDLILHEYHGHGLYCEQTKHGGWMVVNENRIGNMDEEALALNEYLRLTFEGHALWTEDFLLRSLEREDVLEERLEELNNLSFSYPFNPELRTQRDVHNLVKRFEDKKGIFDLWYSFGFPRQFDRETLVEIAKEKLGSRFRNLVFLIHFGSSNPNGDIDLCAVLEDNTKIDEYECSRTIDLSQFNYSDFIRRMRLFDIPITQPLMTGELVCGDELEFRLLRKILQRQRVNEKTVMVF